MIYSTKTLLYLLLEYSTHDKDCKENIILQYNLVYLYYSFYKLIWQGVYRIKFFHPLSINLKGFLICFWKLIFLCLYKVKYSNYIQTLWIMKSQFVADCKSWFSFCFIENGIANEFLMTVFNSSFICKIDA